MGYTNYYQDRKREEIRDEDFNNFMSDVYKVIESLMQKDYKFMDDRTDEVYKNIDDFKVKNQNEIWINGVDNNSCETFRISFDGEWKFCKTARKPYDIAVKAILILCEKYGILKEDFSFDGDKSDSEYINAEKLLDELEQSQGKDVEKDKTKNISIKEATMQDKVRAFLKEILVEEKYLSSQNFDVLIKDVMRNIISYKKSMDMTDSLFLTEIMKGIFERDLPKVYNFLYDSRNYVVVKNPECFEVFDKAMRETFEPSFKNNFNDEESFLKAQDDYIFSKLTEFADSVAI